MPDTLTLKMTSTRWDWRPAVDHSRAPLVEALARFRDAGTAPFSTPGHKQGMGVDPEVRRLLGLDFFAADVWFPMDEDDHPVRAAEALAADAWGADRAYFLVNGSSGGNHAYLLAALAPGDEVIVGRDLHQSLLNALILTGARPIYIAPCLHPSLDIGLGVAPEDVAAALDAHPRARLVALVSPSYVGVASDLPAIVDVAHARGVPVYVDEAWGAHLPFHPDLPAAAMASGADGAVTSTHKLLAGLSQASLLQAQGMRVDPVRLAAAVRLTQTTSRCLPLLASLDATRRQMVCSGEALLTRTAALACDAARRLATLPGIDVLDGVRLGIAGSRFDATRLVIDVHRLGLTGFEAASALRTRFGIEPEMSDLVSLLCLVTIGDTRRSIDRLVAAVTALARDARLTEASPMAAGPRSTGVVIAPGRQVMTPRDAFYAPTQIVPLHEAVGAISAEMVTPYPPGIPLLAPGEEIDAVKIAYLTAGVQRGMSIVGAADPTLATLRVVAEPAGGAEQAKAKDG